MRCWEQRKMVILHTTWEKRHSRTPRLSLFHYPTPEEAKADFAFLFRGREVLTAFLFTPSRCPSCHKLALLSEYDLVSKEWKDV